MKTRKKLRLGNFRPDESGIRKALGDLEAEIMEIVWKSEETTVRDVYKRLSSERNIAYTTVMTVMCRLADKGILKKYREGKHYVYMPAISKEEFSKTIVASLITGIKEDLGKQALAFFVESLAENDETLAELERLIQEKRSQL